MKLVGCCSFRFGYQGLNLLASRSGIDAPSSLASELSSAHRACALSGGAQREQAEHGNHEHHRCGTYVASQLVGRVENGFHKLDKILNRLFGAKVEDARRPAHAHQHVTAPFTNTLANPPISSCCFSLDNGGQHGGQRTLRALVSNAHAHF